LYSSLILQTNKTSSSAIAETALQGALV